MKMCHVNNQLKESFLNILKNNKTEISINLNISLSFHLSLYLLIKNTGTEALNQSLTTIYKTRGWYHDFNWFVRNFELDNMVITASNIYPYLSISIFGEKRIRWWWEESLFCSSFHSWWWPQSSYLTLGLIDNSSRQL